MTKIPIRPSTFALVTDKAFWLERFQASRGAIASLVPLLKETRHLELNSGLTTGILLPEDETQLTVVHFRPEKIKVIFKGFVFGGKPSLMCYCATEAGGTCSADIHVLGTLDSFLSDYAATLAQSFSERYVSSP